ncbi:hypothetical protein [Trueperella pyogenes]
MKALRLPDGVEPLGMKLPTVNEAFFAMIDWCLKQPDITAYLDELRQGNVQAELISHVEDMGAYGDTEGEYELIEMCASRQFGTFAPHRLYVICGECVEDSGRCSLKPIGGVMRFRGRDDVPALWVSVENVTRGAWNAERNERLFCGDYVLGGVEAHRSVSLNDSRVQAVLETQIMGTPRKRISLKAVEKIASSLTDDQVRSILNDGVYTPAKP